MVRETLEIYIIQSATAATGPCVSSLHLHLSLFCRTAGLTEHTQQSLFVPLPVPAGPPAGHLVSSQSSKPYCSFTSCTIWAQKLGIHPRTRTQNPTPVSAFILTLAALGGKTVHEKHQSYPQQGLSTRSHRPRMPVFSSSVHIRHWFHTPWEVIDASKSRWIAREYAIIPRVLGTLRLHLHSLLCFVSTHKAFLHVHMSIEVCI